MNQIGYRGYAQSLGFDPIKAPDLAKKELERGQQEINNLKQSADWNNQNRQQYADALSRKNALEVTNRDQNYQLEKDWRKGYQEAVMRNRQTAIDSAKIKGDEQAKLFESLGAFSKTAVKLASDYKKKRDEADEIEAMNYVVENGISVEQFQRLRAGEQQLDAADQAVNAVANNAPNLEVRNYIRGLSGRKLYGAMKQLAIQGAIDYEPFLVENSRTPVLVNGEYTTLDDAKDRDPATYAAARVALRSEYLKRFAGLSPELANEYLYEGIRRTEAQQTAAYSELRSKSLQAQEDQESTQELLTELRGPEGGQAIINWYMRGSGGDKAMIGLKRREALGLLAIAAEAGQFTSEDLAKLEEAQISLGGAEAKPFAELYGSELSNLRDSVRKYNNTQRQDQEQADDDQKKEFERRVIQIQQELGRNFTEAEIKEIRTKWENDFGEIAPGWIKQIESQEKLDTETGNTHLQRLANRGMLTMQELMSGKYSEDSITKFKGQAEHGNSFNNVSKTVKDNMNSAIQQQLKQSLGAVGAGSNQNASYHTAFDRAQQDLASRALNLISSGVDADTAYRQAAQEVITDIKAGAKGEGTYAINGTVVNGKFEPDLNEATRGFRIGGDATGADASTKRYGEVLKQVSANPNSLSTTRYLNQAEITQIENFGKNGGGSLPPILYAIAQSRKNATIFDVADAQLAAWGKPPVSRPPTAALYDQVSPELRGFLTWRPSANRTVQAVERSGGGNAYTSLLNLIASKESVSTDPGNNGYDAFNTGGYNYGHGAIGSSNTFNGRKLSQMTVGEVMVAQANEQLHATGRYQIIRKTLKSLVDAGVVSQTAMYDQATQDKLGIALIKRRSNRFFSGEDSLDEAIKGMGQEWIGLQNVPRQRLAQALEQTKANLRNVGLNVEGMKDGVVYRVGGIGPKGASHFGPHIDAKMEDNSYFNRNYLDRFVTVNGAPVGAGVTVAGGEFGASRDGGARVHTGWDYAFPTGAQVRLRNGARVVRRQQTSYGLKLSIALPDGRVVNFLHGTA